MFIPGLIRPARVLATITAFLLLPVPAAGAEVADGSDRRLPQASLVTDESNCVEIMIGRSGDPVAVRAVVPSEYRVATTVPGNGIPRLAIFTYQCAVSVDGHPPALPTVVSLGAIRLGDANGVPLVPAKFYLLWSATDNPVLAARYGQLGVPTQFVPDADASVVPAASGFSVAFAVPGRDGLDYTVSSTSAAAPVVTPASGGPVFLHDDGAGTVQFTYRNTAAGTLTAPVTADLSKASAITGFLNPSAPVSPVG